MAVAAWDSWECSSAETQCVRGRDRSPRVHLIRESVQLRLNLLDVPVMRLLNTEDEGLNVRLGGKGLQDGAEVFGHAARLGQTSHVHVHSKGRWRLRKEVCVSGWSGGDRQGQHCIFLHAVYTWNRYNGARRYPLWILKVSLRGVSDWLQRAVDLVLYRLVASMPQCHP